MDTGKVSRGLPSAVPDTQEQYFRLGRYGDIQAAINTRVAQALAEEGSYFVATNPTPGTPVATTTSITTFAETAGAVGVSLLIKNGESRSAQAPKRVILDYIKLMIVQVPTAATSWQFAGVIDDNPIRYTSGGSAIVPVSPNGDIAAQSIVSMYFGALTTAVPNNRRLVSRGTLRGVIPTTFDTFMIKFGADEGGGHATGAAASGRILAVAPPVIIAAQQNFALTMWGASNAAAPSFEFEIGWAER